MRKRKWWQVGLIFLVAFVVYALPAILIFTIAIFDSNGSKKFEVKDNIVEISKGKMKITDMESFYSEENNQYYVTGYLKNETTKKHTGISIEIRIYDKDGYVLGESSSYLDEIKENQTWKFKIIYEEIDAKEAASYEITEVYYY